MTTEDQTHYNLLLSKIKNALKIAEVSDYLLNTNPAELVRVLDRQLYNLVVSAEQNGSCGASLGKDYFEIMCARNMVAHLVEDPKELMIVWQYN